MQCADSSDQLMDGNTVATQFYQNLLQQFRRSLLRNKQLASEVFLVGGVCACVCVCVCVATIFYPVRAYLPPRPQNK